MDLIAFVLIAFANWVLNKAFAGGFAFLKKAFDLDRFGFRVPPMQTIAGPFIPSHAVLFPPSVSQIPPKPPRD